MGRLPRGFTIRGSTRSNGEGPYRRGRVAMRRRPGADHQVGDLQGLDLEDQPEAPGRLDVGGSACGVPVSDRVGERRAAASRLRITLSTLRLFSC